MGNIGAFGGMFDLSALEREGAGAGERHGRRGYPKLAFEMDKHDTIGVDAVAMCVNDVLAQGAEPSGVPRLRGRGPNEPKKIEAIVSGCCRWLPPGRLRAGGRRDGRDAGHVCRRASTISPGFTVGVVEKSRLIDGSKVSAGDVLVGIASSGVHSNGFSLVRKIVADNCFRVARGLSRTVEQTAGRGAADADENLCPAGAGRDSQLRRTRHQPHYGRRIRREHSPASCTEGQGLEIDEGSWEILPVFRFPGKVRQGGAPRDVQHLQYGYRHGHRPRCVGGGQGHRRY